MTNPTKKQKVSSAKPGSEAFVDYKSESELPDLVLELFFDFHYRDGWTPADGEIPGFEEDDDYTHDVDSEDSEFTEMIQAVRQIVHRTNWGSTVGKFQLDTEDPIEAEIDPIYHLASEDIDDKLDLYIGFTDGRHEGCLVDSNLLIVKDGKPIAGGQIACGHPLVWKTGCSWTYSHGEARGVEWKQMEWAGDSCTAEKVLNAAKRIVDEALALQNGGEVSDNEEEDDDDDDDDEDKDEDENK